MADYFWRGGTGVQQWNVNANWSTTQGGASAGSYPGASAGDSAYINAGSSIIAGFTVPNALDNLDIRFSGSVGSSTSPLVVSVNTKMYIRDAARDCYLSATQPSSASSFEISNAGGVVTLTGGTLRGTVYAGQRSNVMISSAVTYSGSSVVLESAGGRIEALSTSSASNPSIAVSGNGYFQTAQTVGNADVRWGTCRFVRGAGVTLATVDDVLIINSYGTFSSVIARAGATVTDAGNPYSYTLSSYKRIGQVYSNVRETAAASENIVIDGIETI